MVASARNIFSMPYLHCPNCQLFIWNRTDDPALPLADTISPLPCKCFAAWRSRIFRKRLNAMDNLPYIFLGFGTEVFFNIAEYYRPTPELDRWLRRRLRMCYFKKGPWRLSRTLATQTGMTNTWLKDQGILSVKELWVHIHYPATAR